MYTLDNLTTLEFFSALAILFAFTILFYFMMRRLAKIGKYARIFLWGLSVNLMSLFVCGLMGKWAIWPLYNSWAIFVVIGYSFADALFYLISSSYRRCPGFYQEKILEVTFPRGGEIVYYGLQRLRKEGLGLNPRISTWAEIFAVTVFAFPYAALFCWDWSSVVLAWVSGLLGAVLIGVLGFVIDFSAAILRFRCPQT